MIKDNLHEINSKLPSDVTLVAVSKFHPVERLMEAYNAGQRVFAESRPQELAAKVPQMPGLSPTTRSSTFSWNSTWARKKPSKASQRMKSFPSAILSAAKNLSGSEA